MAVPTSTARRLLPLRSHRLESPVYVRLPPSTLKFMAESNFAGRKIIPPIEDLFDAFFQFGARPNSVVPDTEIDWQAYMDQVAMFLSGERDYTVIKGGTGPLVYPAAHLYIYSALYYITEGGKNILLAQIIFGGLYLSTLGVVMACYRLAKVRTSLFGLEY